MATDWQIGDKIPDPNTGRERWQVYHILRGGMGIIYIVYDTNFPGAYAIKTFQDEVFARSPAIADRFKQEAIVWINLDSHQNITEAQFVHNIADKPHLFLEWVSGGDLSDWIGTPRLTEDLSQVLRFAIQFCDGMTHAFAKGITVHRDIKPQNCLVTKDGTLKVTDFGLAKVFDEIGTADVEISNTQDLGIGLTRTGVAAGTCTHMAPEQFDDAKHVDVRADIYSFGVMLFQMVMGRLPFIGRTWQDLENLHKDQPAPLLSVQSADLSNIVQRCLAKDVARRYAGFNVIREELAEIYKRLTGESAPQAVMGAELDAIQWNNKGASLYELGQHEEALACWNKALNLNPLFEQAWLNKGTGLYEEGQYEEAIAYWNKALEINPLYPEAWLKKGAVLSEFNRHEEALACFERAIEIKPDYVAAWSNKGGALGRLGRHQEALDCSEYALSLDPRNEDAWFNKGKQLSHFGRHKEAITSYDHAIEIKPRYVEAWTNKGVELGSLGRYEEALTCLDTATDINPRFEQAWTSKGNVLYAMSQYEKAKACYERAIEINPRDEVAWNNKGYALSAMGRHEEALKYYDRSIEINSRYDKAWGNKAIALMVLKRLEEAITCFGRVLEIDPHNEFDWLNKGVAHYQLGRGDEALACYNHSLEINSRSDVAWYYKGIVLAESGRLRAALDCFETAQRLGHPDAAKSILWCRQKEMG
ncbi:MAG TPA: serine/threonine-protein kinase [Pyrinomonadaceae bacterium]|nr:serine/threonine-protein kinase [Pyrinomonadaceae bacterium]